MWILEVILIVLVSTDIGITLWTWKRDKEKESTVEVKQGDFSDSEKERMKWHEEYDERINALKLELHESKKPVGEVYDIPHKLIRNPVEREYAE